MQHLKHNNETVELVLHYYVLGTGMNLRSQVSSVDHSAEGRHSISML